jgi:hypothetical protein
MAEEFKTLAEVCAVVKADGRERRFYGTATSLPDLHGLGLIVNDGVGEEGGRGFILVRKAG